MIIVVMGVCGSGKTTIGLQLADQLGWRFAEGDDLHPPANKQKMSTGMPLIDEDRWPWLNRIYVEISQHRRDRKGLVISCSALKKSYREKLVRGASDVLFVHLTGTKELLSKRMTSRHGHFMPETLLDSQLAALEIPGPDENALSLDIVMSPSEIVSQVCRQAKALGAP